MIFARKMPEFYIIIAQKIFFPNFSGARAPLPLSPTPLQSHGDTYTALTHQLLTALDKHQLAKHIVTNSLPSFTVAVFLPYVINKVYNELRRTKSQS